LKLPDGCIAVLAGYTLERATCGLIKTAKHRVVCLAGVKCMLTIMSCLGLQALFGAI
jgi:isopenicillin N synthase-like dioxygenase